MSKCKDSNLGKLLHAYEINALSEEKAEKFELHMIACEYCFNQFDSFAAESTLLSTDNDVRELIRVDSDGESVYSDSLLKRLWQNIWPDTHLVFRPALPYLIILMLIFPLYWGLKSLTENEIRPVQTISFFPGRQAEDNVFKIGLESDGMLNFLFSGAVVGKNYLVTIEFDDGKVIFQDDNFDSFDGNAIGRLLLPFAKMTPGVYRLVISDPQADPPFNKQEYSFRIEK